MADHTAGGQMAGYRWQTRRALLTALREPTVSQDMISVERDDDVSLWSDSKGVISSIQAKHSESSGTFGDKSALWWKTLHAWIDGPDARRRVLCTTQVLQDASKLKDFVNDRTQANRNALIAALDKIAAAKGNNDLLAAYRAWLEQPDKEALIDSVYVEHEQGRLKHFMTELEGIISMGGVRPIHVPTVARKVSQWWDGQIDKRLSSAGASIAVNDVHRALSGFVQGVDVPYQYRSKQVPPQKIKAIIDNGGMTLLQQMALVGYDDVDDQTEALTHYYEAGENREVWQQGYPQAKDDLQQHDASLLAAARAAKREAELEKTGASPVDRGALFFCKAMALDSHLGGKTHQGSLPQGTLHYYSNKKKIGWHPDYDSLL